MELFNVEFNKKRTVYSPTFYGEHKVVQIVSDLPPRLNDCDFYIVTFSMDGRLFDSEQITSESTGDITIHDSKIYINLSQDYTNCNTLVFCVSGYKVGNDGETEFIGKTGDSSTIVIKDTIHLGNELLSDEPSLISRIREGLAKIRELARDRHFHQNKAVLDEITQQTLTDVSANSSARHSHTNKDLLDRITDADIGLKPDWDENNEQNKGYIANRTHWKETIKAQDTYSFVCVNPSESYWVEENGKVFSIDTGEEYTIVFGEQEYPFVADEIIVDLPEQEEDLIIRCVGNEEFVNAYIDGREYVPSEDDFPFVVVFSDKENMNGIISSPSLVSTGILFGVIVDEDVYHRLSDEYLSDNARDAVNKRHSHSNKAIIDGISAETVDDIAANTNSRHSHKNASALDRVDNTLINNVLSNTESRHTHFNKDVLDDISQNTLANIAANSSYRHIHDNKTMLDRLTADDIGIKPDWDEGDIENKNYIANRTHWAESSIVSNDYTVDWLAETPPYSPQNWDCIDLDIPLEEDVEYTLIADGQTITGIPTKIELDVGYVQKHLVIGNLSYLNGLIPSGETYEDNGFPMLLDFAIEYIGNQSTFNLILTNEDYFGNDLAFSVGKEEIVYHPLEINYLPKSVKDAVEMKHTHTNNTILDDFSESNGILQYNGHAVPQFPINDVEPTTEGGNDYYLNWINPNMWYRFGSPESPVTSINIYQLQGVDNSVAEEYVVEFWTGATAPSPVIFPSDVEWPDGSEPVWAANKHYQVSIVNNVGLYAETDYGEEEGS